ncbi:MAG TPA: rhodanese-like domain-containing protein [Gemmatimonadales bacterium]|jgi:rhodanese-related sulfurtransferase|nr:rhodanese-like domain-containing protein [Gemmatimonadales bacterium]
MHDTVEPPRVSVNEAQELTEQGQAVLLDVRDARLYDNAHIKGALSLPLGILTATPEHIPEGAVPDHPGLLLFYCA